MSQQQQSVKQFTITNPSNRSQSTGAGYLGGSKGQAKIVPAYRTMIGEFSPPTFIDAILAYRSDTDTYGAVNFLTASALYNGFFVTGDETYENGDAIKCIEDFNRNVRWGNQYEEHGLLPLFRILTPENLYSGNTFIEMQEPDDLQQLNQIQIATIWRIIRNEDGSIKEIWQKVGGIPNQLDPETIIHIPFRTINREAYGAGVLEALIRPRLSATGEVIPPWYVVKASMEYDIYRMMHRRGSPRSLWDFPDVGDEELDKYKKELANPAVDATFVTNSGNASIDSEKGGPVQGLQFLIQHMDKRYQAGLQTPINNLLNSSGYTEASARVAKELGGMVIQDIQLRLKQAIEEELWTRVLIQNDFDPAKAKIELNWGTREEPDYTLVDVMNAFDRGVIHGTEYRKILRQLGWELDDDSIFLKQGGVTLPSATIGGRGFGVLTPPGQTQQPDQNLTMLNPLNPQTQAQTQGIGVGQYAKVDPSLLSTPKPGQPAQPAQAKDEVEVFEVTVESGMSIHDARWRRTHKYEAILRDSFTEAQRKAGRMRAARKKVRLVTDEIQGRDPNFDAKRYEIGGQ